LTDDDIKRTKYIASLLEAWGLVTRTGKNRGKAVEKINVRVINFNEKSEWTLKQKYDMSKNIKKVQPTE
jgi:putative SOS response-associated peptidase YedK